MNGIGPEQFVREHAAELLRGAVLLTGNRERAEDLVQETLTRLLPQWQRVQSADSPLAYVRRSLVNRFVSQRRRRSSSDITVWEVPDVLTGADVADGVATRRSLWQVLGTLPARQRAAVVLRYYDDLTDPQIATTLGCRDATVRSLISRALHALRATDGVAALFEEEAR